MKRQIAALLCVILIIFSPMTVLAVKTPGETPTEQKEGYAWRVRCSKTELCAHPGGRGVIGWLQYRTICDQVIKDPIWSFWRVQSGALQGYHGYAKTSTLEHVYMGYMSIGDISE